MTLREEVRNLFITWTLLRDTTCGCWSHHETNHDVCLREKAWRTYVLAREKLIEENRVAVRSKLTKVTASYFEEMN